MDISEAQDPMFEVWQERKRENQLMTHFQDRSKRKFEDGMSEASRLYRKAVAADSNANDQYMMGVLYYKGRGVKQSDEEALRWWGIAAARNHASSAYSMAVMHHNGRAGLPQLESDAISFAFMRSAAGLGHAKAMYNMGLMFTHGRGVAADKRKAARWFGNAANEGIAAAQYEKHLLPSRRRGGPESAARKQLGT
eukprot:CAMPEP_0171684514 /NCGR_PEP_ID=MMETSP0991-20121206/1730_1 /TAXON_ID=483369 /ORGANISM="non described non described, Strain CCMP2098" /LENGTH=194 /DNA_ID=CAMNT_0012272049 /DNA_START=170 /DNA_END=754 /DNA_ORIENTATION=+